MKKNIFYFFVILQVFSQHRKNQNAFFSTDFLSIKMPDITEKEMSFSGIHYNLNFLKSGYFGVGFYGAVTGKRGGFFTLGANVGFQKKTV